MTHYKAREQQVDGVGTGVWKYTACNDGRCWEVGYCSGNMTCPECQGRSFIAGLGMPDQLPPPDLRCQHCNNSGFVPLPDPCRGHATPEEACAHYQEYLLDKAEFLGPKTEQWPKHQCQAVGGCAEEALYVVSIPGETYRCFEFCETHKNRDELAKLIQVGESWRS